MAEAAYCLGACHQEVGRACLGVVSLRRPCLVEGKGKAFGLGPCLVVVERALGACHDLVL